jgi:hypothetical protein
MDLARWQMQPLLDGRFPLPLDQPFTAAQARHEGVPRHWLTALTASGHLNHPIKNCYVAAQVPDDLHLRTACLRLVTPGDAVIVDRHAGWAQGANMVLLPNEHLEVMPVQMFLPAGRGRLRNALVDSGERTFIDTDITVVGGVRMTTPLRTALDLGRQRWPEPALTALDALHRLGTFTVDELMGEIGRFKGMRWVRTLRLVASATDGRSQSGGETVIRWRWLNLDVPPPEPQVEVSSDGRLAFIDVGHEDLRAGVEYDGIQWHEGKTNEAHDEMRRTWLDEDADWSIRALTKEDVYGRNERVQEAIHEVLTAGVRRSRRRTLSRCADSA